MAKPDSSEARYHFPMLIACSAEGCCSPNFADYPGPLRVMKSHATSLAGTAEIPHLRAEIAAAPNASPLPQEPTCEDHCCLGDRNLIRRGSLWLEGELIVEW